MTTITKNFAKIMDILQQKKIMSVIVSQSLNKILDIHPGLFIEQKFLPIAENNTRLIEQINTIE